MSANLYSIENLLIGKPYYSRSLSGEIVDAEKHPACVHYDNANPYLVRVRDSFANYHYRTLAVACD